MDFSHEESTSEQGSEHINERFTLFKLERTFNEARRGNAKYTEFNLQVELPDNQVLPVRAYTTPLTSGSLDHLLTPFNPDQGQHIDQRDFDYEKRVQKVKEFEEVQDESKYIAESLGLHMLDIECQVNGLTRDSQGYYSLPSESPLNLLRLILVFPNGVALESRPKALKIKMTPTIHFPYYYPIDAQPLATKTGFDFVGNTILTEGLSLALPNDLKRLQEIKAYFYKVEAR